MKKLGSIVIVAMFGAMALTSCKKDYTCTCTTTDSSGTFDPITSSIPINDAKKGDATDACDALESTVGTLTTSCNLD